ncbi:MAG: hypothetical protein ACFCD0_16030 [Gemmataceae bacterium]
MHHRTYWYAIATCLFLLTSGISSGHPSADIAPPEPIPMRVARAELIFAGEVVGHLDQDIKVLPTPNAKLKTPHRIVVIRVDEAFVGTKKGQLIKAGYPAPRPAKPGVPVVSSGYRVAPLAQLKLGQKAVVFLNKHSSGKFVTTSGFYGVITTPQPGGKYYTQQVKAYSKQLDEIRFSVKVLSNPTKALQSEDAKLRLTAASMAIAKYRAYPALRPIRMEPIDPKESTLILKALLKADWKKPQFYTRLHPLNLFFRLGISKRDGLIFPPQTTSKQLSEIVQRWLRDHATTYRIRRFVGGMTQS